MQQFTHSRPTQLQCTLLHAHPFVSPSSFHTITPRSLVRYGHYCTQASAPPLSPSSHAKGFVVGPCKQRRIPSGWESDLTIYFPPKKYFLMVLSGLRFVVSPNRPLLQTNISSQALLSASPRALRPCACHPRGCHLLSAVIITNKQQPRVC